MEELNIDYESYISILCFLENFEKVYTNEIITNEENYSTLIEGLKKFNSTPNINVIAKS